MNSVKFNNKIIQRILYQNRLQLLPFCLKSDLTSTEEQIEVLPTFINDDDSEARNNEIENKRNVSRLLPQHRNMLNNKVPYDEPQSWIHNTEKYKRMMFGRYGLSSGVDPKICFPNNDELAERKEYQKVAFPLTLQEMLAQNQLNKKEKADLIQAREDLITKKLEKLEQWKTELHVKISKKESDAKSAKDRKDRLVEEVRRHFGYKVDPRDDKFKEMLELKEKEDKKRVKEEKKKVKEAKMMAKLTAKNSTTENDSKVKKIEENTKDD